MTPTMMITVPTGIPVSSLIPVWNTSHGAAPRSLAIKNATPVPNKASPAMQRTMRVSG